MSSLIPLTSFWVLLSFNSLNPYFTLFIYFSSYVLITRFLLVFILGYYFSLFQLLFLACMTFHINLLIIFYTHIFLIYSGICFFLYLLHLHAPLHDLFCDSEICCLFIQKFSLCIYFMSNFLISPSQTLSFSLSPSHLLFHVCVHD